MKLVEIKKKKTVFCNFNSRCFFLLIGKLVYHPSLIDEEIKKPLILETLKLALPKKKLNTM